MTRAFIGIGSNVDRETNIRSSIRSLRQLYGELVISPVYESRAFGFAGDNFFNLVAGINTDISPLVLFDSLREIESRHERARDMPRFSPRTLDLDLLLYGELVCHEGDLDIPRADIVRHSFVLRPLADIAGDFRHPESGKLISDLWRSYARADQDIWPADLLIDE